MRLCEYLEVGKKMKKARSNAGINQRTMAEQLGLSNSAYSNYENGYSDPPVEIILNFCDILGIDFEELLEIKLNRTSSPTIRTFSDFLSILIDLDRRGLPIKSSMSYVVEENQLIAHLTLDLVNAQLAVLLPDWHKVNEEYKAGLIDEDRYNQWLESNLQLFNVPIDTYLNND